MALFKKFLSGPKWGARVLGILLIWMGVTYLVPSVSFHGTGNLQALVAIVAGVLILIDF
jgi:hypothetical protein